MAVCIRQSTINGETFLLELQGQVVSKDSVYNEKYFGNLAIKCDGTAELILGSRLLQGKVIKLSKPVAVLRSTGQQIQYRESNLRSHEFQSIGIIRKKILFNTRPKVICEP